MYLRFELSIQIRQRLFYLRLGSREAFWGGVEGWQFGRVG